MAGTTRRRRKNLSTRRRRKRTEGGLEIQIKLDLHGFEKKRIEENEIGELLEGGRPNVYVWNEEKNEMVKRRGRRCRLNVKKKMRKGLFGFEVLFLMGYCNL